MEQSRCVPPIYLILQTVITTEDVFKKIGYLDAKGERIACCDEDAYRVALWK